MANYTVAKPEIFPEGVDVGAYAATDWRPDQLPPEGPPLGTAVDEATVTNGEAALTGLDAGGYYLGADLGDDNWRYAYIAIGHDVAEGHGASDAELAAAVAAHVDDSTAAHAASAIANTPAGAIAATNVQTALNELDTEKEAAGVAIPKALVDANGDIIAASGADTPARVAVGADRRVLSADSGAGAGLAYRVAPIVLDQRGAALVAPADTSDNNLATVVIPANSMGPAGALRVWAHWTCTNNANAKTVRVKFGGSVLQNQGIASTPGVMLPVTILNRNATNSQIGVTWQLGLFGGAATQTAAIDTTVDQSLLLNVQKATAGDTVTLEAYSVELIPG